MNKTNKIFYERRRQELVYSINQHANFLTSKLNALTEAVNTSKGPHFALLTQELIGASSCIPLIVKDLGCLREEYAALSHE